MVTCSLIAQEAFVPGGGHFQPTWVGMFLLVGLVLVAMKLLALMITRGVLVPLLLAGAVLLGVFTMRSRVVYVAPAPPMTAAPVQLEQQGLTPGIYPALPGMAARMLTAPTGPEPSESDDVDKAWDKLTSPKITLKVDSQGVVVSASEAATPALPAEPPAAPAPPAVPATAKEAEEKVKVAEAAAVEAPEPPTEEFAPAAAVASTEAVEAVDAATEEAEAPAPGWEESGPRRVGAVWRRAVTVGPYPTAEDCEHEAPAALRAALLDYARTDLGAADADEALLDTMGLTPSLIRREYCPESRSETIESSVGPMQVLHLLLELDPHDQRSLETRYAAARRSGSVARAAGLSGAVLGVLALTLGLLKLDEATRGYYSMRLLVGGPAVIIAVALAIAAWVA